MLNDWSYNDVMKNKEARKVEIIKNSIELMYLKGYNGTSVKDITSAAGIPKGSFYNYFEDKEQYAVDVLDYYCTQMREKNLSLLENKNIKALDRIKEFFKQNIVQLEDKGLRFGCLAGNLAEEMGDISEPIAKATAKCHNQLVSRIHANLVEAAKNKDLVKNIDLNILASFIVSGWQGAMLRMKATNNRKVLDEFYIVLNEDLLK